MSRVFANGLGDWGSIPGRVIPKTQKMVPDATLLSTQHYMVRIKGRVEQSSPPLHLRVVAIEKKPSGYPRLRWPTFYFFYLLSSSSSNKSSLVSKDNCVAPFFYQFFGSILTLVFCLLKQRIPSLKIPPPLSCLKHHKYKKRAID